MPGKGKNYVEASASGMLVYTLAKGVRLGFLPENFIKQPKRDMMELSKNLLKQKTGR
jgi:unsaturated rhamnogalacturonyl hydrolase